MFSRRRLLRLATYCVAVVCLVACLAMEVQAEMVIDYDANDGLPQAAGWTLTTSGTCTGAMVDDAGTTALYVVDPLSTFRSVELSLGVWRLPLNSCRKRLMLVSHSARLFGRRI